MDKERLEALYKEGVRALNEGDIPTGFACFREAAKRGHLNAQFNLALLYMNGQGVEQDDEEAERWFLQAAAQGDADALRLLGVMYGDDKGGGVGPDYAEAAA